MLRAAQAWARSQVAVGVGVFRGPACIFISQRGVYTKNAGVHLNAQSTCQPLLAQCSLY